MANDKYYRITKDEALFNAYIAYANTNNPDDRAKIENLYDSFKKGKISTSEFNVAVMQAAKAQGKTDVAKQGGTPTTDGAHTEKVTANPGNGIDAQGKSEIPNSSAVSDANAAKTQVEENPQPQAPTDVTADVMKAIKADGNTSFANWRQSLVNQGWNGDPSKIKYDPSTGKFMYNVNGQVVKSAGKPALDQQPQKAGKNNKPGKKPRMSDAEIDAFLKEELGTTGWSSDKGLMREDGNGTYASAGVPKGGTKTIGYDPNPGNVSLAYAMRNAPEQERRDALINEWNRENGRLNRSSGTYASPDISNGGMYATGEGIKDANGNVLTNPGGDWEYQYALRDPAYGLGMMGKMSDAQKKYLQAVADDMGYNYNFTGATRFV